LRSGIVESYLFGPGELHIADHRINRQIRVREVLLIDAEGTKRGVTPIEEALREAEDAGLDLVEVAGNVVPPVCKIMDYGKLAYQAKKKKVASKSSSDMKEISFSMKISEHDLDTKLKQARKFIESGHKLRFNLILRGRERVYADTNGLNQLRRLAERMVDIAQVEQMSDSMLGNRLYAILSPVKVKVAKEVKEKGPGKDPAGDKPGAPKPPSAIRGLDKVVTADKVADPAPAPAADAVAEPAPPAESTSTPVQP
jgi:translation initiation factor IF-3